MYKSELENFVNTEKIYNGHANTQENIKFWRIEELTPTNKESTIYSNIGNTIKRSYEIDQLYLTEKWRIKDIIGE